MDCYVVRDVRYITFEFIFDGSDARSAARERTGTPFVRQNVTFPQIPATLACGTSVVETAVAIVRGPR